MIRLLPATVCLALLGCVEPPLVPSSGNPEPSGVVSGHVTVTGVPARGDTYVLLLPQGGEPGDCPVAGDPLVEPANVVRLPEADVFSDGEGSTHSAPFTIPLVPPGCWSLSALVDADDDFNPLFSATAGASRGDAVGGAFVEPLPEPPDTPVLRVLDVARRGDLVTALTGVQVLVAAAVPFERPSFTFEHDEPPVLRVGSGEPLRLELTATALEGAWARTEAPSFPLVPVPAADGVGAPGVAGVRVLLRRLAPAGAGRPPWAVDESEPWQLAAAIDPAVLAAAPAGAPIVPVPTLPIVVPPLADDADRSPAGRYGVFVLLETTRQTWQVPNELLLLDGDAGQGAWVEVSP